MDTRIGKTERLNQAIADLRSKPHRGYADTYNYLHAEGYLSNNTKGKALGLSPVALPMHDYVQNLSNQLRFFKTIDPSFTKLPVLGSGMKGKHIKAMFNDPHNTDDASAFMSKIKYSELMSNMSDDRSISRAIEHNAYAAFGHHPELSKHLPENKFYPNKKPFGPDNYRNLGEPGLFEAVMKGP